tara:strand:- start:1620 stop:2432 length:813 start_codon:yes stop_codon:yes gene_type:complete
MIDCNSKILFFGCGKMGSAILQNFLDKNIDPKNITIIDPLIKNKIINIDYFSSVTQVSDDHRFDLVIFAFKPQEADKILSQIIKYNIFCQNTIFVSILAGIRIEFFANFLGQEAKIIRIMPNLPMAIGEGISAFVANNHLGVDEVKSVMGFWSKNLTLKSEKEIDLFTAIAGSGPAYLFLFAKELIEIAKKSGIEDVDARKMVVQMLYGSSKMLLDKKFDIVDLIDSVTSKGGTTEAGLNEFYKGGFKELIERVVEAACSKSKELGLSQK